MTGESEEQREESEALDAARERLARARGRQRLDVILEARDPAALVQSLPGDDLYLAIREIGLADAPELVRLASPEQFRAFVDLDAWKGDALDVRKVFPWIRAARSAALSSDEAGRAWREKLAALDPEVLSLVLRGSLVVHDLESEPDPEVESDRFMRTPEGRFLVEFTVEGTEYVAARAILDELYADDPFRATRILAALRWELESELAESALRWRSGRLADLGYPSRDEALSWFARPPRTPAAPAGAPDRPRGFFLTLQRGSLLDRAVALLPGEARQRVELELVAAANAVIVADAIEVTDPDAVRGAFEAARANIEMGLEALSAGAGDEAAAASLASTPLKRVFQRGFGQVLELAWRAERLFAAGGAGTRQAPLLDPPLGEAMAALARKRPRYHPGLEADLEHWGTAAAGAFEPRAFRGTAEVRRASDALRAAEALVDLAKRLGLVAVAGAVPRVPPLSLAAAYLTALANERLGRGFRVEAIPVADLPAAARALEPLRDPRLETEGDAGALLARLARGRAEELAPIRRGESLPVDVIGALLVRR